MAKTTSLKFPNMFDTTSNRVKITTDNESVVNRSRLLLLTQPTELYMNPNFGVGLKKYLWQYNTKATKAIIEENIKEQLRLHEPCVDVDMTEISEGLFSELETNMKSAQDIDRLKMTVSLHTIFSNEISELHLDKQDMFGDDWDSYIKGE